MTLVLGKNVVYKSEYDPKILHPIARSLARSSLVSSEIKFYGVDIWNCYELSWLNSKGKPEIRIAEIRISSDSDNIIESKSLKLYLNSFNNTRLSEKDVIELITKDITEACAKNILVKLHKINDINNQQLSSMAGESMDDIDIECDIAQELNPKILTFDKNDIFVSECLHSNLLKANCLVTGQPDFGSVQIKYSGQKIDHSSLLRYITSFRNHNEFHEHCVERIFHDINTYLSPKSLTVYARFTRRGGIDINPYRSSERFDIFHIENARLARQ